MMAIRTIRGLPQAIRAILSLALLSSLFAGLGQAQEWSRFRGPNGSGLGIGTNLPSKWSESDYLWRAKLPGKGHSSPVLWGDKLFVTSSEKSQGTFATICLRATDGAVLWRKEFPAPMHRLHANNDFASATPAADAHRVFVLRIEGGALVLTALTHGGESAWEFKSGAFKTEHGLGHSPIVFRNRVIFADDQDLAGRVVALDAESGRLVWETPRHRGRADYSTPCVLESEGHSAWLILNSHEDGICALDADTGALAWTAKGVLDKRSVSSPVVAAGLLTSSCGSGGGGNYLVALRPPDQTGPNPSIAYEIRRSAPYVTTPLALGEWLFLWSDGGIVTCVQAATGSIHWQERVGGNYFSSPICVDGKLYGTSTTGQVVALSASSEFKELGRSSLGEAAHATPAVADGRIYFRTLSQVMAIGPRR
jgi:outer membrane protein assembly factor BamB